MENAHIEEYIELVNKRIREIRIEKKLTQVDLAIKAGIDERQLQRMEANKTAPTLRTLLKICFALGVDLLNLLPRNSNN